MCVQDHHHREVARQDSEAERPQACEQRGGEVPGVWHTSAAAGPHRGDAGARAQQRARAARPGRAVRHPHRPVWQLCGPEDAGG